MTWSEIFQKVPIKQPGPSQKKIDLTVRTVLLTYLLTVPIKRPVIYFFQILSLERPSIIKC